ncbi:MULTISPECIES: NAD(P)H-quinone dehydrogenase [Corynebacterium]|uniref:NAD(P)H-quinone dehydrogenase n=1 Tax=Corynebacterium coyleae TaxID=53374 RepID=A0AAP7CC98_9CORY|nr:MULTISPECIES: NAD(P)H-quinone dehydrogenase [Corynebacterium]MDK6493214.1 NAD(P)H-quinone dehydrogenase [Corynebacterium coyleae]MDK8240426.1 NAD(P)H-quinone dehydrogenase [Corynebacterium coyleae]MDK8664000.1 NAD(P)H-quinone dehydrogenase [Corynebacterium coyleae]MDK8707053.1 NAD(P)H-quinone dehydrogenase [Corynebacterium coyleae]MDK8733900.1 NAD(P)H-quinone dehydrogenase [Corynebacterium coyleae]
MSKKIVIMGGGPGGYEAALLASKRGADITLVEDSGAGGSAIRKDVVPSKSFIAGANIKTDLRRADDMGLNHTLGDAKLSLLALNERVKQLAAEQSSDIREQLERKGVRLVKGRARFSDKQVGHTTHDIEIVTESGETEHVSCDMVLVCTGASPRVLKGAEPDGERILNWRQMYDLQELPTHLIVVGSGVTGAEFVSAFAELGVKVTMVASRDRILPHDDADAADVLEKVLADRGVQLEKDARVERVENTGDAVVVHTTDGRAIEGSHVMMSIGSVPNTADLNLEAAKVETTPSGHIHVDRVSRTNVAGIYAAGDCTDLMPLASVAAQQGRTAVDHAMGDGVSPIRLKTVGNAVFTRPEIAAVGVTEQEIRDGKVEADIYKLPLSTNPRAKMRSLQYGFVKIFARKGSGQVIGGVIVAPTASELILSLTIAVTNSLTVTQLANSMAVYPSLSGSITEAARRLITKSDLD